MLLWAGFLSILAGLAALLIDRQLAHFIYDHIDAKTHRRLDAITHYAKAGHWLAAAILALIVAAGMRHFGVLADDATQLINYSLAFIASLTMGSALLHAIKLVLGRRRRAMTWRWGSMVSSRWPSTPPIIPSPPAMR